MYVKLKSLFHTSYTKFKWYFFFYDASLFNELIKTLSLYIYILDPHSNKIIINFRNQHFKHFKMSDTTLLKRIDSRDQHRCECSTLKIATYVHHRCLTCMWRVFTPSDHHGLPKTEEYASKRCHLRVHILWRLSWIICNSFKRPWNINHAQSHPREWR